MMGSPDGMAKQVEAVLNPVLEAPVSEALGAERHERAEERTGYCKGYRTRRLYPRIGPVALQVPQTRDGRFSTKIFKCYQRSEQAFVLALMERVVQGVSTRKVSAMTEELCGASFSQSTVSRLCAGLDVRVRAFNERRLEGEDPFLPVDALFNQSQQDERVQRRLVLIVSGLRRDGLRDAIRKPFHDAPWQRCPGHRMRHVLGAWPSQDPQRGRGSRQAGVPGRRSA